MNEGDKLNSYLRVNTQFTAFEFLDFSLGAQGWAIRSGFSGGQIGGIWGVRMRLTDEFEFGWEHFSCHVSTGGGVTAQDNCGSEDSIILRFNYNFDTRKKSSILGKIIR